jgi:hypothetical protein
LGLLSHSILHIIEWDAEGELGCYKSKRVSCGFGGKRRGTGETGVDLDDAVFKGFGVECVLDVTLSNDAKMPHNLSK